MTEKSDHLPTDGSSEETGVEKTSNLKGNLKKEILNSSKILDNVNKDLLVSKLAFFFFFMAMGAYLPFLGVFYKQLWLNARQSGILLGIRPFIKMLCSPLWGMVTDVCNKPKWILLLSILGAMIAHFCQSVVSPFSLPCYPETNGTIDGLNYSHTQTALPPFGGSRRDEPLREHRRQSGLPLSQKDFIARANIERVRSNRIEGETSFDAGSVDDAEQKTQRMFDIQKTGTAGGWTDGYSETEDEEDYHKNTEREGEGLHDQKQHKAAVSEDAFAKPNPTEVVASNKPTSTARPRTTAATKTTKVDEEKENHKPFITKSKKRKKPLDPSNDFRILENRQIFVTLLVIVILGEVIASPAPMLTDSGTLELLSGREYYYGRQRLFGSIGWGIGSLFSGAVVAALNTCPYSDAINYVAVFYVYAAAMLCDFITCFFFKFKNGDRPVRDLLADKGFLHGLKLFATLKNSGFIVTLFFLGFSHSLQLSFLFWFLQDIGGTPLLFALILTVNALSEVLMFFVATNLVQKIGHDAVLYLGIGCYGVRFLMYSYLENPWFVLPLEVLQGFTYGGAWTASVSYVGSQPGSGATVQGILHGVYWGLGMAVGGVLGGFMVHDIGARLTFRIEAACAFAILVLFFGINNIDQNRRPYSEVPAEPEHGMEDGE